MIRAKLKAASIHALVTGFVALLTAALVFVVWYPGALSEMVAGAGLFLLVMGVEVVLGPAMSLVIYNPKKDKAELLRDYAMVGLVQLAALAYGLYTVAMSRPVYLVFVKDRIEVVSAIEFSDDDLVEADLNTYKLPWFGPEFVCTESPTDPQEKSDLLMSAMEGKDIQMMPKYYRACMPGEIEGRMFTRTQWESNELHDIRSFPKSIRTQDFGWLPIVSRFGAWVAIYPNQDLEKVEYFDQDPFFADSM